MTFCDLIITALGTVLILLTIAIIYWPIPSDDTNRNRCCARGGPERRRRLNVQQATAMDARHSGCSLVACPDKRRARRRLRLAALINATAAPTHHHRRGELA